MHVFFLQITHGNVQFRLPDETHCFQTFTLTTMPSEQELETIFRHVSNTFVHHLELDFHRKDLSFPYYLRSRANDLHCQIMTLHVEESEEGIDYALVDFLGVHLQPQIYRRRRGRQARRRTTGCFSLGTPYAATSSTWFLR